MIKVTKAMLKDATTVYNVELKSQEYPVPLATLKEKLIDPKRVTYKATIGSKVVGVAGVFHADNYILEYISVHPEFRGHGVSKKLMESVCAQGSVKKYKYVNLPVPDYKAAAADPDTILPWLVAMGFRATKSRTDAYKRYGRFHDAYIFHKDIK